MKSLTCKECQKEYGSIGGLHGHIKKSHGLEQEEYYRKHFPRLDKHSGKPLKFKNVDDYFSREFNDVRSEFAWLKNQRNSRVQESYLINLMKKRFLTHPDEKFIYSAVEWNSMGHFRMGQLWKLWAQGNSDGDWGHWQRMMAGYAKAMGLKSRFDYSEAEFINFDAAEILIDTREQQPLFEGEKTTLNVGDYTYEPLYYNGIHIDRKSQDDFIGTFTNGIDRFRRECEKAKTLGIYLVVLVESPYRRCLDFKPSRRHGAQRVRGTNAFFNVRKISQEFDNLQFLFVKDRDEARKYARIILSSDVKRTDLQLNYNIGKF